MSFLKKLFKLGRKFPETPIAVSDYGRNDSYRLIDAAVAYQATHKTVNPVFYMDCGVTPYGAYEYACDKKIRIKQKN